MQKSFNLIQLGTAIASLLFIVSGKDIRLGVLLPITGSWSVGTGIVPTIDIAIEHIKSQPNLLNGYNITYVVQNSACSITEAVGRTADLLRLKPQIDVIIGPGCSKACLSAAPLAKYYNKPMISYSCSSTDLEDRVLYSTFSRTQPFSRTYSEKTPEFLVNVMQHFRWRRAAILAAGDAIWGPIARKLKAEMQQKDMIVALFQIYKEANVEGIFSHLLEQVKSQARVVFIIADRTDVARLILLARDKGMLGGEYAFITLDFYLSKLMYAKQWSLEPSEMKKLVSGLINLVVKKTSAAKRKMLTDEIQARLDEEPGYITLGSSANVTSPYLYDAILLYAHALNRTLAGGQNISDGKSVVNSVVSKNKVFTGMTGPVHIDSKGSRVPTFVFENILEKHNVPLFEMLLLENKVVNGTAVAVWPGGSTRVPDDDPECVFHKAPSCIATEGMYLWLVPTVICVVLLIIVVFSFIYYKKKRFEKDLLNDMWLVDYNKINLCAVDNRFTSRIMRSRSMSVVALKTSQSDVNNSVPLATDIGKYKNELVAIKRVRKDCISLSRDLLIEMKQVRDLSHQNLVPYMGVSVKPPNICILSHYCYRGSLEDILAADDIKLDWFFRVSFANDITMGMAALHASPVKCHGRLKSSKCLIDSRWVCKVTDYGMNLFTRNQRPKAESRHSVYKRLFWTAPELLLTEDCPGTQAGDVYSFGIIMYELLTRDEPYSHTDSAMEPEDIVQRVKKRMKPLLRPEIPDSIQQELLKPVDLMRKCWHDLPAVRPSFNEVKTIMKHMHSARNTNIVDNMLRMMETYTDQLEDLVDQRTRQLAEEKAKTDELLYKMLPRPVAEELKMGRAVPAECFAKVTIFFSDIVGFTKLAAESSPLQVVDFLNDLYTCFDKVIDAHDVYKVETIGDAYMVVSGLPVPNGKRHAAEIATMALHLLSSTTDFQIGHRPHQPLQLRIGIHSGPCVAGVVGLKMPRYCLFGDTVNYASRIESSGIALRIHVSPECRELLEELGNFQLEKRGPVSMKGKGTIVTYFLNGMDGFTKPLPDLRQAASLDEHTFK